MNTRRLFILAPFILSLFGAIAVGGCFQDGQLVDGECVSGLSACDNRCVSLASDPSNCGACGNICPSGSCVDGLCIGSSDSGPPDAVSLDGDASNTTDSLEHDGSTDSGLEGSSDSEVEAEPDTSIESDGSVGPDAVDESDTSLIPDSADEPTEDSSTCQDESCTDGSDEADAEDECKPPFNTVQNCGACGVVCQDPTPICAEGDGGVFGCASVCPDSQVLCGTCVDPLNDALNCGYCGHFCPSGLCQAGQCRGVVPGHFVLIGSNYRTWLSATSASRVLQNAAFLSPHNPVRILEYTEFANSGPKQQVSSLLSWAATDKNRTFQLTDVGTAANLVTQLSIDQHDLLLVLDQSETPAGGLASIGLSWSSSVINFARAGGIVVILASASGQNEMPSFVSKLGLIDITSASSVTGDLLVNSDPLDAIGINVTSPFLAWPDSAGFEITSTVGTDTSLVVTTQPTDAGTSLAVVVHRAIQ